MAYFPIRRCPAEMIPEASRRLDAMCGQPFQSGIQEGLWHPIMDVYNRAEDIVVELEIPGMDPDQIEVSIEQDHLIVEGTRSSSSEFKEEECYYSERPIGGFHRIVHLPTTVDPDMVKATYKDGVLRVRLPKQKRLRGKKIELNRE